MTDKNRELVLGESPTAEHSLDTLRTAVWESKTGERFTLVDIPYCFEDIAGCVSSVYLRRLDGTTLRIWWPEFRTEYKAVEFLPPIRHEPGWIKILQGIILAIIFLVPLINYFGGWEALEAILHSLSDF